MIDNPHLLVIESNTPDLIARGSSGASGFMRALSRIAPKHPVSIFAPYSDILTKDILDGIRGVLFSGASVPWSTSASEARPLRTVMEAVFDRGLPCWGSCNGMQLGAVVLGGDVGPSPNGMEIGVARNVTLTHAARNHPMMAGRPVRFAVPCIHRDEVTRLPDGAELMAGNDHSPIQAIAYSKHGISFWGTQYHPELGTPDIAGYLKTAGLFQGQPSIENDLLDAPIDEDAAMRLGTSCSELSLAVRATELANWIEKLKPATNLP